MRTHTVSGNRLTLLGQPDLRLPPGASVGRGAFHFDFAPPFNRPFVITTTAGAEHSLPTRTEVRVEVARLEEIHARKAQRTAGRNVVWTELFDLRF